jgi:hypothetical protein
MYFQIGFFAQNLPMEQPGGCKEVNQKEPIWEYQKLANEDEGKGCIDGIAAEGKNAGGYEFIGMVFVDADTKALAKGEKTPQEERKSC